MRSSFSKTLEILAELAQASCASIRELIEKAASRKLLVWAVATFFTYTMILDPQLWFVISMVYLGVQGALDWKGLASGFVQYRPEPRPEKQNDLVLPDPEWDPQVD